METDVLIGDKVTLAIDGHSANNGAPIPEGSTVSITNNDPTVATFDTSVAVPPGGAQHLELPVTILAKGSTDAHVTVTTPDGSVFEGTATLVVAEPVPGLASISVMFVKNE